MRLLTRAFHTTLFVLAVSTVAGCSRNPPPPLDPKAPTMLRVENQAFLDMNIFVVYRGQRIRVGFAGGSTTTNFRLPMQLSTVETLRFIADPVGSNRLPVSEEILVSPGDVVTLTIPPQ